MDVTEAVLSSTKIAVSLATCSASYLGELLVLCLSQRAIPSLATLPMREKRENSRGEEALLPSANPDLD